MRNFAVTILIFISLSVISFAKEPAEIITENNVEELTSALIKDNVQQNIGRKVYLNGRNLEMSEFIFKLYELNDYQPIWSNNNYSEVTDQLIALLEKSYYFGISKDFFLIDYIKYLQQEIQKQHKPHKIALQKAELDFILSNSLFQFVAMLQYGQANYLETDFFKQDLFDITTLTIEIYQAIKNNVVVETVLKHEIKNAAYMANVHELKFLLILHNKLDDRKSRREALTIENLQTYIEQEFNGNTYLDNFLKETCLKSLYDYFYDMQENAGIKNITANCVYMQINEIAKALERIDIGSAVLAAQL